MNVLGTVVFSRDVAVLNNNRRAVAMLSQSMFWRWEKRLAFGSRAQKREPFADFTRKKLYYRSADVH